MIRRAARHAFGACWLALTLCGSWAAQAQLAVPPLTGHVVDQTATLNSEQKAALEQTLIAFEANKGSQLAVLIVPSTAPEDIAQYALRVAEQWKLGRKKIDDGAIMVVAKNDRAMRIEVGYGLEGALNDATAKRIISETILPRFKGGDYPGGISAGVARIIGVVGGEPLPAPNGQPPASLGDARQIIPVLFVVAMVVGSVLRAALGRIPGAVVTGGVIGVMGWAIAGAVWIAVLAGVAALFLSLLGVGMGGAPAWRLLRRWWTGWVRWWGLSWWRWRVWRRRRFRTVVAMNIRRVVKHVLHTQGRVARAFPPSSLNAIENAITAAERLHAGEIRFVVEGALDGLALFKGQTARERAVEVFSQLHLWDTEHNNGLLIYLLLADQAVEILADRGIHAKVSPDAWDEVCRRMESQFKQSNFEDGVIGGVRAVAQHLAAHFPADTRVGNELSDQPVVM